MAMKRVETNISVKDIKMFELFLEANGLEDVVVSYYSKRVSTFQLDNLICYHYSDKEDCAEGLTYMKIRYNGLENAFNDYMNKIDNMKAEFVNEYTNQ